MVEGTKADGSMSDAQGTPILRYPLLRASSIKDEDGCPCRVKRRGTGDYGGVEDAEGGLGEGGCEYGIRGGGRVWTRESRWVGEILDE